MGIGAIGQDLYLTAPEGLRTPAVRPVSPRTSESNSSDTGAGRASSKQEDAAIFTPSASQGEDISKVTLYDPSGVARPAGERKTPTDKMLRARTELAMPPEEEERLKASFMPELRERDTAVRTHEQIHKAYLGPYAAGDIQYQFTVGPDGFDYAMSGNVPVDLSRADTPEETLVKAKTIQVAALAPENLSTADRLVAAKAKNLEKEASRELSIRGYDSQGIALLRDKAPLLDTSTDDKTKPAPLVLLDPGPSLSTTETKPSGAFFLQA